MKYLLKSHEGQKKAKTWNKLHQILIISMTKFFFKLAFICNLSCRNKNVYFATDFSNFPLTSVVPRAVALLYRCLWTPWCWVGLGEGGEGDDRGWDGWMASPTQWTWVWVNSGSWYWTMKPGALRFMGSQKVRHNSDWTELTNTLL